MQAVEGAYPNPKRFERSRKDSGRELEKCEAVEQLSRPSFVRRIKLASVKTIPNLVFEKTA